MLTFHEWLQRQPGYDEGFASAVGKYLKAAAHAGAELALGPDMGIDSKQAAVTIKNAASAARSAFAAARTRSKLGGQKPLTHLKSQGV